MTPGKGFSKRGKTVKKKAPPRPKKRVTARHRRPHGQVLKRGRIDHRTTGSRRLPRTRRNAKRRQGVIRSPTPRLIPHRRQRPQLRRLSHTQRQAVDSLLLKVYQQAAKDLAELEARERDEAQAEDRKLADRFGTAREELMRTLADWARRQRPKVPRT